MKFCVVGAGIVGLSTALELQKQFPNANVTIIADKFNQETTSDGAAGLIMPANYFKGPTLEISKQWMIDSFNYYKYLMDNIDEGIIPVSGYVLSNDSQNTCENEYMKLVSSDYRSVTTEELEQFNGNFKYGVYMTTMVVASRKLLPWSLHKFKKNRGIVINNHVDELQSLARNYDALFNCSGLGAKRLCGDSELTPIRGQILQVKAPLIKNFYMVDLVSYIIPCGYNNIVTLGGTQDYGSHETAVDVNTTNSILDRCSKFVPNLRKAPVVRSWVGLRPYRPKVRTEMESRNGVKVIHNYGHGGYGVTTGPGSAMYAVQLFSESHRSSANRCKI